MSMNVIRTSIELQNYVLLSQYIGKAESSIDLKDKDLVSESIIKVGNGLYNLELKKYKTVAKKMIETPSQFEDKLAEIFSSQDVGTYGALFALVEYDREELKNKCLDDSSFKNFLELVPTVKDLVNYYYDSKYEKMLECLSLLKNELKYDYILSPHLDFILKEIRNKALVQYVTPYTQIDLKEMAKIFNSEVSEIEEEIARLIQNKKN